VEKLRCQSCGMPLTNGFFGTNKNKSLNEEYCKYCFQLGKFTKPKLKRQDAVDSSIEHMILELKLNREEAEFLANKTIPSLKRWKK